MNAKSWLIAAAVLAAPVGVSWAQPIPILEYRFSETGTPGTRRLDVFDAAGTGANGAASAAVFGAMGTWMFFAATFDGTSATGNNLNYYVGTTGSAVTSAGSSRIGADGTPFGPTESG